MPASQTRITMFEKRGAVSDRKSLAFTLWLLTSLAMLASMLVTPVRSLGFVAASCSPDAHRGDFALPATQDPFCFIPAIGIDRPAPAIEAALRVIALPFEDEEQDRAAARDEPRVFVLIPCSFRKVIDSKSIAPRPVDSLYPLRC